MVKQEPTFMYRLLSNIPVFGSIFGIANAYAYKGDPLSKVEIASFSLWWKRVFRKIWYVLVFVCLLVLISNNYILKSDWAPADTILGAFPSILGFGIGVYALMFIMPSDFLLFLKEKKQGGGSIGPELVSVDMGYPLITYVLVMIIAAINKLYPDSYCFKLISLWALFYGLAMTVELISFLFLSSQMIQKIRTSEKKKKMSYFQCRKNKLKLK
ncbi:hypothetical protein [Photobacterium phosphoreum]|uniref:hypothetical protein n=1 Tax=Photobacterium phosphoreum TaxID=659 RepID=UPI001E4C9726|nr:hypothetical protein [Photobacterium phosphoreum]MCD9474079.1 hypothetical protein [Photobacterium phosphoreum]MCD9518153.1 hypothetical protein [Photobacterium phosphoreum]MCF2174445.1 hypothetical protein [Photobacterium phosphoreum]